MDKFTQIFNAPGKYVQGRHAIQDLGRFLKRFGCKKALVVGGKSGLGATREGRVQSVAEAGLEQVEFVFGGECTYAEVERICKAAEENGCDAVIGSGGGKALDAAKLAADRLGLVTVILPTIAATDSPCSAVAVMYDEAHCNIGAKLMKRNPDLVLVDLQIIADAPVRFLVSGMGDAIATYWEADANRRSYARAVAGGMQTETAFTLARLSYDLITEHGVQAKAAAEDHLVTPALAKVVEANVLLSGCGFESCGCAAAHALQAGFSVLPEIHNSYHGEQVAFFTLAQFILESRPTAQLDELYRLNRKLGLPLTMEQLGITDLSKEHLLPACEATAGNIMMKAHPFPFSADSLCDAVCAADALGKKYREGCFPFE